MNNTSKLLLINLFFNLVFIYSLFELSIVYVLMGYVWWLFVFTTAISSGYHRHASHNAFKTHYLYKWYYQFMGIFANTGPAISWCIAHRAHHAHSDTELDPTNPKKRFITVFLNIWGYSFIANKKYSKDLLKDKSMKFFYKYYFVIALTTYSLLYLIDFKLFFVLVVCPIVFAFFGFGIVNTLNHRTGKAENNIYSNILIPGEGWHKNHHKESKNYRIGKKWYEIDIPARFIELIAYKN